jgi:hypothetical protein
MHLKAISWNKHDPGGRRGKLISSPRGQQLNAMLDWLPFKIQYLVVIQQQYTNGHLE